MARMLDRWVGVTVVCAAVFGVTALQAQPLVTGDLTIYYDFDNFTDFVMDGSGNGFNGKVKDKHPGANLMRNVTDDGLPLFYTTETLGEITNDTVNAKRGAGSIKFSQSEVAGDDPVFVDMDGGVIAANNPTKVPKTAVTYAAWINLTTIAGDASVIQGSSLSPEFAGGHGNPHFQIQGSGEIRATLRANVDPILGGGAPTVVDNRPFVNQPDIVANGATPIPFPLNEWHHLALTYDAAAAGGAGDFDVYYDGVNIATEPTELPADLGTWGLRSISDYYDGLGLGAVYDSGGRRTDGNLDELYIFTRALSAAEIAILYNLDAGLDGDYNEDGTVNAADYTVWRDGGSPDDTMAGYDLWKANFGASGAGVGAAVPEPSTIGLLVICVGILVARRRK